MIKNTDEPLDWKSNISLSVHQICVMVGENVWFCRPTVSKTNKQTKHLKQHIQP